MYAMRVIHFPRASRIGHIVIAEGGRLDTGKGSLQTRYSICNGGYRLLKITVVQCLVMLANKGQNWYI